MTATRPITDARAADLGLAERLRALAAEAAADANAADASRAAEAAADANAADASRAAEAAADANAADASRAAEAAADTSRADAAAAAGANQPSSLVAVTEPVPTVDAITLYAAAVEADLEAALWLRPSQGMALVGIGRAWATEPQGPDRFATAEAEWHNLLAGARLDVAAARLDVVNANPMGEDAATRTESKDTEPSQAIGGPTLLGGLGFTGRTPAADDPWGPFGASSLVLPQLLLATRDGRSTITAAAVANEANPRELERTWTTLAARAKADAPNPNGLVARPVIAPLATEGEQPDHDHWRRLVGMFAGAVGRGRIDKVVLARRLGLRSPVELDVPNALRRLAASAPESTIYAFRRGGRTFIGATPERLVRTDGRTFKTVAVAGTIGRGADAQEDARLAQDLLDSEKDREEHAIVVAAIRDVLRPVAETIEVAKQPGIMTLRFVQHLVTEIGGTVPEGNGLLSLGARLHPTPAVGGEPRDVAVALIDEHEGFDRGWYAGPIGWLGADGDGELCVALRCGIVDRTRAWLFAGCGIVADSNPDREWEESRIKLRAVLTALGIPADER